MSRDTCPVHGTPLVEARSHDYGAGVCPACRAERDVWRRCERYGASPCEVAAGY